MRSLLEVDAPIASVVRLRRIHPRIRRPRFALARQRPRVLNNSLFHESIVLRNERGTGQNWCLYSGVWVNGLRSKMN